MPNEESVSQMHRTHSIISRILTRSKEDDTSRLDSTYTWNGRKKVLICWVYFKDFIRFRMGWGRDLLSKQSELVAVQLSVLKVAKEQNVLGALHTRNCKLGVSRYRS